jgi:ADP-heptose:LPS heptosyltransferase
MRILALQLKRIGDLILTTPAVCALRAAHPKASIALAVAPGCASLLNAIPGIDTGIVLGKGRGFAPWQQVLTGAWDVCLDFTGNDRSALAAGVSRAKKRVTFAWVKKSKLRAALYHRFVDSPVRDHHTVDHYLDLAAAIAPGERNPQTQLRISPETAETTARMLGERGVERPFAVLHPGTARPEKYWLAERWVEIARHLHKKHGLRSVITGGSDPYELAHIAQITEACGGLVTSVAGQVDLLTFAAILSQARVAITCDTGAVHLAAAFQTPQVALFGPTNPFHWRPRHTQALVLSAAHPEGPLSDFQPRMKGASMDRISTDAVIHATDSLLKT